MIGIGLSSVSQSAPQSRLSPGSAPEAGFGGILDQSMTPTEEAPPSEVPSTVTDEDETEESARDELAAETAQEGALATEPLLPLVKNGGAQPDLRFFAMPGLPQRIDAPQGGNDELPDDILPVSPGSMRVKTAEPAALPADTAALPAGTESAPSSPILALEIGSETPANEARHAGGATGGSPVTDPSMLAELRPEIEPMPADEMQDVATPGRQAVPPATRFPEEAAPRPVTLQTGSETVSASTHHEQPDRPRARAAGFNSALAQNIAEQMAQIAPETDRILIKLKPHGMGLLEMELSRDQSGRHDISVRVQNTLVLDALRIDKQALLDLLGGQGAGATLDLDLYQPDPRAKDQSDAQPAPQRRESEEAGNEAEEPMRPETATLGATNILI
ncbi:hypothetical protein [Paracoccus ravus]|uniref:hypothetical protein n=1 Tax=Paracoccus ravus TaxID=2447760 RepID=UPI0014309B21|nr:hypothetical protein [Paracoccus ravus]